ncbi:uncharacterized protein EV154DRAFT_484636 [Mucor mucedo]|uniref:uncharacterized protein n=1 Tax=Mucor mucedo TaxID=29922 RepID=UPI00221F0ADF|nr:uncharacterized protein EV154DRAFT_484636 [Mucor mucedo]KAI7887920.1 hypothetical protein EV154DRAFT_484636 [Mucor mucedo]
MLLQSVTEPGKWVEHLKLQGSLDQVNRILGKIILRCPNVETFECGCIDWKRFYRLLTANGGWFLLKKIIPSIGQLKDPYYYEKSCNYFGECLTELHLKSITFSNLKNFTQLKKLRLGKISNSLLSVIKLIGDDTPQLLELDIIFYEIVYAQNRHTFDEIRDSVKDTCIFSNIKTLTLANYKLYGDEELELLKHFGNLKKLTISIATLEERINFEFLIWASKLATYCCQLKVVNEISFMKYLCDLRSCGKGELTIEFTPFAYDSEFGQFHTRAIVSNGTPFGKMNVALIFCMKRNSEENIQKAMRVKHDSEPHFDQLTMRR